MRERIFPRPGFIGLTILNVPAASRTTADDFHRGTRLNRPRRSGFNAQVDYIIPG